MQIKIEDCISETAQIFALNKKTVFETSILQLLYEN
jgi:hypothetical protein